MRKSKIMLLAAAALAVACAGCQSTGTIQASAVDVPMRACLDRHDAYVAADTTLDATQKSTFLRSSEIVRKVLDAAASPQQ